MFQPGVKPLGRYEIDHLIATGGMADVFLARDDRLDRAVAIKAFRIGASDRRRFEAEVRILANLVHRNLIRVFDVGEHDGVPFVVLEHVDGPTLAAQLQSGPVSAGECRRIGVGLARGLQFVHDQRIVHRDVKPSNVLLAPDGRVLLGDFGVAVLLDATRLTVDAATIGTAAYLAPEQVNGEPITSAADVYALGLLLLEASTGRPAFRGTFHEIIAAKLRDASVDVSQVDPALRALLSAMTDADPAARPNAARVADLLADADSDSTAVATVGIARDGDATVVSSSLPARTAVMAPAPDPVAPHRRALVAVAAFVAVAAALVLAAGLIIADRDDPAPSQRTPTTTAVSETPSTVPGIFTTTTSAENSRTVCAEFEARKRAVEAQKQQAERTYRDDKDTLEEIKEQLEDEKREIEQEKQEARC